MARFLEVIDVPLPLEAAFEAVADFRNTAEWDPGVTSARCMTSSALRVGSRFRVEVSLFGRTQTYGYAITELNAPSRVVLEGGAPGLRLTDEICFVARRAGTRITYEVRCELPGIARLADPALEAALQLIGRRGADGLARWAEGLAARTEQAA